ncbi:uncharacterized protein LOC128892336 isoform X1 [Hylaeus anthracinus]|uniref:uncharacterized protein LOC128892336 isoform X1 n=1 Tax=Hylaeus anthracinus TaxID=313031 RepID=UPI0023B99AC1|nr:uncharacterized protein LOC128892336 isoform X1 [Hylaeus anthracinus]
MPPTRASRGLAKGDLEVSSRTPSLLLKTSNREQFSKVTLNIEGNYLRILTRHREVCTEFCNQKFFLCIKTMSSLEEVTYGLDRLIFRDTHIIGQYGVSYIVTPLGMPQLPLPPRFFAAAVPQPPPPPPTFARRQRENVVRLKIIVNQNYVNNFLLVLKINIFRYTNFRVTGGGGSAITDAAEGPQWRK